MTSQPPQFHRPPVIETVLGVEFAPLEKWGVPYYGLFWAGVRSDYPRYEIKQELAPTVDPLEQAKKAGEISVQLLREPSLRCWFHDTSGQRLLQLQADRFIHNWRKTQPSHQYPRHENIRPIFDAEWRRFTSFVAREQLGEIVVRYCEVSYVNQIPRGEGWMSLADLGRVFRGVIVTSDAPLPELEAVQFRTAYPLPDKTGRINVEIAHAIRQSDLQEVLQFTITVRGRPTDAGPEGIGNWMDQAHEWALRVFFGLTTDEVKAKWREG